jgi:hypothetical protein
LVTARRSVPAERGSVNARAVAVPPRDPLIQDRAIRRDSIRILPERRESTQSIVSIDARVERGSRRCSALSIRM